MTTDKATGKQILDGRAAGEDGRGGVQFHRHLGPDRHCERGPAPERAGDGQQLLGRGRSAECGGVPGDG